MVGWGWGTSTRLRKACVSAFDFLLWPSACHTWRTQWGRRARWYPESLPGGRSSSAGSSRWCYLQRAEKRGGGVLEETGNVKSKPWHTRTTKWVFHHQVLHPLKLHMWCTWQAAVFSLDIKGGFVRLCMRGSSARKQTARRLIPSNKPENEPSSSHWYQSAALMTSGNNCGNETQYDGSD